ncbi:MAG: phage virion morphogenesis protein [Sphingomonadaceae bacterium]
MSGVGVNIKFSGQLSEHLARLAAEDGRGFEGARREVGDFLVGQIKDNLDHQLLADRSPMPPSAAAAARSGRTLIDNGHLSESYVYQLTGDGLEVGSAKIYAAIHHFGGQTGRGHKTHIIPRPVMGIGDEEEREIGDILLDSIRRLA